MSLRLFAVVFACTLLGVSGCGYSARRSEAALGGANRSGSQRIFIPVVDNLTARTGFEATMTNALREALSGVRGVTLVDRAEEADFFLLGTIAAHTLGTRSTRLGTAETQAAGGLARDQATAADLNLTVKIRVQLVELLPDNKLKRQVWSRDFEKAAVFDASRRNDRYGDSPTAGSASAPHINGAREEIQFKALANLLAQQVFDQVVQDF